MANKIVVDAKDALNLVTMFKETLEKGIVNPDKPKKAVSGMAAYLLTKYCGYQITDPTGALLEKSELDEITLDFTRGRTLTEEEAEIAIQYIYDMNPYLSLFNTRIVNKLVVPVKGTAITQKNLISNEQNGGQVTNINRRIVHNFGVNLFLRHCQLQKDIPLQTVIDNLYNPGWEQSVINDVAIALGNDILLLAINGLGGNYASTEDFYDLNLGFNKMLQIADGTNTNTYGDIKVKGFLGRYLTPHKVDASMAVGDTNYNAANLLALMRKMYKAMPRRYRDNPNNVFLMSQADLDLYVDSRSDMTTPSNVTREQVLTTGQTPKFMGCDLIAVPGWIGINETHESDATLYGSIVFGDPKNMDIATDSMSYRKNTGYNARAELGPAFEYTYDMYLDFQLARADSFVVAFKDAQCSAPILLSSDDAKGGVNGYTDVSGTYTLTGSSGLAIHVCCPNEGAVVVCATATLESADTLADAMSATGATVIPENGSFTVSATDDFYLRAYHPNMLPSDMVTCSVTIS